MVRAFSNDEHVVEFSLRLFGLLRAEGVKLGTLQTLTCTRAITLAAVRDPDELLRICRSTLVNRKEDLAPLQRLFAVLLQMYFSPEDLSSAELQLLEPDVAPAMTQQSTLGDDTGDGSDEEEGEDLQAYSLIDVDRHRDFRDLNEEDFPKVLQVLERIAAENAALARRKSKRSKRGSVVDLRASIRESVRFDGEIFDWRYKRKIPTHTRLTVVVDVSGSMEIYSVFLLNFLHLINQNHRLKIEVFAFSTELQPLTEQFRAKNFRSMLANVSANFSGWSGGTKIGHAVEVLNESYRASVTAKTMVVIMSDGWDTGDVDLLDREIAKLKGRAKSIIWINPLKGDASYEPLAIGMATARPYCDEFISGHSIAALQHFGALIA